MTTTLLLIPILLLLSALLVFATPWIRGRLGEARVAAVLDRIGAATLHDVILPDGRGGLTQVDHLMLTGAALVVVETKNYRGSIFGREREPQWTQRLGRRSFSFQNPLRQNYLHTQAVQALAPGARVHGWVVFTDSASFPKGRPPGVSSLSNLRADLRQALGGGLDDRPGEPLQAAWNQVKARAETGTAARRRHLAELRQRHAPNRRPLATRIIAILVGTLVPLGLLGLLQTTLAPSAGPPTRAAEGSAPPRATRPGPDQPLARPQGALPSPRPAAGPTHAAAPSAAAAAQGPAAARPAPTLEWTAPPAARVQGPEGAGCNAAIAALLIDNSEDNQRRRDRACRR